MNATYQLAVWLMLANAALGAADTLWYHEYRARLPHHLATTRTELRLHAVRDAVYVFVYASFAIGQPTGGYAALMLILLAVEIVVTMIDFIVEDRTRPAIGGMAAGERVLHTAMAIVYGAAVSRLVPSLVTSIDQPARFVDAGLPMWARVVTALCAVGIAGSGMRDARAAWQPSNARTARGMMPRAVLESE